MSSQVWFDFWEIVAGLGTATVIVGLFVEYGLGIFTFLKVWGKREIPESKIKIETPLERTGGAVVMFGIAIELVGTIGIFVQSLKIEIQHRREIAELQFETAQAQGALVEFKKEYGPRQLTEKQEQRLITDWHRYAHRVVTLARLNDAEAIHFAGQLVYVLNKAGVKVNQVEFPLMGEFVLGVMVRGPINDPALYGFADSLNCVRIVSYPSASCAVTGAPPPLGSTGCELKIDIGFNTIGQEWKDSAKGQCRNGPFAP